jgi:hypothetical protein
MHPYRRRTLRLICPPDREIRADPSLHIQRTRPVCDINNAVAMPIALAVLFCCALCAILAKGCRLVRPPDSFSTMVARQFGINEKVWARYGERQETRREHLSELRALLGLMPFGLRQPYHFARWLAELTMQTDEGVILATALVQELRREKVVLPPINVIECICTLAITRANRKICSIFADALNDSHRVLLQGS